MYIILVKDNFVKRCYDYVTHSVIAPSVFVSLLALGSVPYAAYHYGPQTETQRHGKKWSSMTTVNQSNSEAVALRLERLRSEGSRLNELGKKLLKNSSKETKVSLAWDDIIQAELSERPVSNSQPRHFLAQRRNQRTLVSRFPIDDLEEDFSWRGEDEAKHKLYQAQPSYWPVKYGYVSSNFGWRGRRMHKGMDIAAKAGTEIHAVEDGTVIRSTKMRGYGNIVELQHGSMYTTRYAHNIKNLVQVGDIVKKGEIIALVGSTGRSTGNHVHFEVRQLGSAINPAKYLAGNLSLSDNVQLSSK